MPTYEYRCERCGATVEVVQSFADAALTTCEACAGPLRKVYAPVGIVFKGSGFYKTDSRSSASRSATSTASSDGGSASTDGTSGDGAKDGAKTDGKTDGAKTDRAKKDATPTSTTGAAPSATPAAAKGAGPSAP